MLAEDVRRVLSGVLEFLTHADVAQLVERQLPKLEVAGSKPVVRSLLCFDLRVSGLLRGAFGSIPILSQRQRGRPEIGTTSRHSSLIPASYLPLILRISHFAGS